MQAVQHDDLVKCFIQRVTELGLPCESGLEEDMRSLKGLTVGEGDLLLRQGEAQLYGYFIASGVLTAQHYADNGCALSKEFYFEHELCFLYKSFLTQAVAGYQVEAVTEARLLQFPLSWLNEPAWQKVKVSLLSQQLIYKEEKEAFLLLKRPEARYRYLVSHRPMWVERLSNLQLARYIGITPVSLSRLKARLKREHSL